MGLFFNWNKTKATPGPSEPQEPQKKEKPTQPVAPFGDPKPHPKPEEHPQLTQQETPLVDHAKPQDEIEMHKFVFRLSSHDPDKCSLFVKEVIRKVNRHDWHNLSGRIGKHSDGIKMRIEIKGNHNDIQSFMNWCKIDHLGVHAYEVMESKAHSMPYSGFPPFQEQKIRWSTS